MNEVLAGARVAVLASGTSGLVAMARLHALGARVRKVETARASLVESAAPAWFSQLHDGIESTIADLQTAAGRAAFDAQLEDADVLLSCDSLAELAACGYAWETLARRFPRLAHVAIVPVAGEPKGSRSAPPECDLTLSARVGLLEPGPLPRGLFVECAAAERAVTAIVCALYASARGMPPAIAYVALAEAADALAAPLRGGLTGPGTLLGGGFAGYGIYRSADGFVALGACESPYFDRVCEALLRSGTFISFEAAFASQPGAHWERIAGAVGFPLAILYGHN